MKKQKRPSGRPDDSHPIKPAAAPAGRTATEAAAEHPSYGGPTKSKKPPAQPRASRAQQTKAGFEPKTIRRPRARTRDVDYDDQQPRRTRGRGERQQYIRLRVRVSRGRLSVVDSHLVDGPLGQTLGFPGTNAYEVVLGDRLLHAGALPDLGVQRSFPNPDGPREQHGHYLRNTAVYEFTARVAADEVTPETIGKITVRLHRVKEEARADRVDAPLGQQFEREMRPIAELVGLPESVLPDAIERRSGRTPSI